MSGLRSARDPNLTMDERLKILYPMVNEEETPLPRCWSFKDKFNYIGLSQVILSIMDNFFTLINSHSVLIFNIVQFCEMCPILWNISNFVRCVQLCPFVKLFNFVHFFCWFCPILSLMSIVQYCLAQIEWKFQSYLHLFKGHIIADRGQFLVVFHTHHDIVLYCQSRGLSNHRENGSSYQFRRGLGQAIQDQIRMFTIRIYKRVLSGKPFYILNKKSGF